MVISSRLPWDRSGVIRESKFGEADSTQPTYLTWDLRAMGSTRSLCHER